MHEIGVQFGVISSQYSYQLNTRECVWAVQCDIQLCKASIHFLNLFLSLSWGCWSLAQLSLGKGGVHPNPDSSSFQGSVKYYPAFGTQECKAMRLSAGFHIYDVHSIVNPTRNTS